MSDREQIELQMRKEFETAYKQRLLSMQQWLQKNQYQTLQNTVADAYKHVLNDQILTTMIGDKTTIPFIEERVKELFLEIVNNERQLLIHKLGLQLSDLEFHFLELKKKYTSIQKQMEEVSQKNVTERKDLEVGKFQASQSLQKKNQQIYQLKLEIHKQQSQIKEQITLINHQKEQINILINQKRNLSSKMEELESQADEWMEKYQLKDSMVRENQKKEGNLSKKLNQMQTYYEDQIDQLKRKFQRKVGEYKNKIEQYKQKMLQVTKSQQEKYSSVEVQKTDYKQLQRKMMNLTKQSERKMRELKDSKEKDKIELQRKYEARFKDLQEYYDRLLEEKILQSQKITLQASNKIKEEERKLKEYIDFLQNNTQSLQNHQKLYCEYENLKDLFQKKLDENQKQIQQLLEENQKQQNRNQFHEQHQDQLKSNLATLRFSQSENNKKISMLEEALAKAKNNETRFRSKIKELQAENTQKEEQIRNSNSTLAQIRRQKSQLMSTINDKQVHINDLLEQFKSNEEKLTRERSTCEGLKQKLNNMDIQLIECRQLNSEKDHEIRQLKHQSQFDISCLNSKLSKTKMDLKEQLERIEEFEKNNRSIKQELCEKSRREAELQTKNRKLQLEVGYHRQAEESLKTQHQLYVADFKKKIQERNKTIDSLESDQTKTNKEIKGLQNQLLETTRELKAENKRIKSISYKAKKHFVQHTDDLNRKFKDLKSFVKTLQNLYENQTNLCLKTISIKVNQEHSLLEQRHREQIKKIKGQSNQETARQQQSVKEQLSRQETYLRDRHQSEINEINSMLSMKERDVEKLQREKKKLLNQKEQLQDKFRTMERNLQSQQGQWENERVQEKGRVNEIIREFDNEKEKIIQKYEKQKAKSQEEISDMMETIKIIKKDLQTTKIQHEHESQQHKLQKSVSSSKVEEWQRAIASKDEELIRQNRYIDEVRQHNQKQSHEINELKNAVNQLHQTKSMMEFQLTKISGELSIHKQKADRLSEENMQLQRDQSHLQEERREVGRMKEKLEIELKEIKIAISKGNKNQELRALQQLDLETKELTSKVNELKRVNILINEKTPLRS